ncbi:MAG: leucyl aminopeptidase family protein [Alphaproteobacteria bacterium]|nr:leucyl aminopeptidase family protein [Alphaproteobacteria bacterium]
MTPDFAEVVARKPEGGERLIVPLASADLPRYLETAPPAAASWVRAIAFTAGAGALALVPDESGAPGTVLYGLGRGQLESGAFAALAAQLPPGRYRLAPGAGADGAVERALAWASGLYRFDRYRGTGQASERRPPCLVEEGLTPAAYARARRTAEAEAYVRDLVNTPANDLGPEELEGEARALARALGAEISVVVGEDLLSEGFPLVHWVGRASTRAPRLIDLSWGAPGAPRVTLVGKGVCFDTGGLNLKPGGSMANMKKDMAGAAHVLGLARIVVGEALPVRLRVLVPAVDNAVSGGAFRPGDVLPSRKGPTVEIGNTDAEGRLILADALALADEDAPDLLVDLATLTGAARTALGPEVVPFYTDDEALAADLARASRAAGDPLWRMPLYKPYAGWLDGKVGEVSHISDSSMAGSITAALFLQRFVEKARSWAHFDIYAWNDKPRPGRPSGAAVQALPSLLSIVAERYGVK